MELKDYLALRYPLTVIESEEGGYFAELADLPGCMTQAETMEELEHNIRIAKRLWLEVAIADGIHIKIPGEKEYSGKLLTRLAKSLHRELAEEAEAEGISLNSYISYLLASRHERVVATRRRQGEDRLAAAVGQEESGSGSYNAGVRRHKGKS